MLAGEEEDRRQVRRWVDPASERRSKRRGWSIQSKRSDRGGLRARLHYASVEGEDLRERERERERERYFIRKQCP
jgi:hypothetical protein